MMIEDDFLANIDASVRKAERLLSMADAPEDDPEAFDDLYEQLFHCEVCTVREVLEVVWPPVQEYIDWLKGQIPAWDNGINH